MTAAPTLTIPDELRTHAQWVGWRLEQRPGQDKGTKVPYSAHTGHHASSTDPSTWCDLEKALRYMEVAGLNGIGFVVTDDDDIVGVDLDHVRDAVTGAIDPKAQAVIDLLDSYTEVSPSGEGIRIFVQGSLPVDGRKHDWIELYQAGRFLTVTGRHLEGTPSTVEVRIPQLRKLYREHFGAAPQPSPATVRATEGPADPSLRSDDEVLRRAFGSRAGGKIQALWNGDTSGHQDDDSSADLALCNYLAFWTGGNADQMDRLFRQSQLLRPKWDERHGPQTYGELTIGKALDGRTDFYATVRPPELRLAELPTVPQDDTYEALLAQLAAFRAQILELQAEVKQLREERSLFFAALRNDDPEVRRALPFVLPVLSELQSRQDRGTYRNDAGEVVPLVDEEGWSEVSYLGFAQKIYGATEDKQRTRCAQVLSEKLSSPVACEIFDHYRRPKSVLVNGEPRVVTIKKLRPKLGVPEALRLLSTYRSERPERAPRPQPVAPTPEAAPRHCPDHPNADLDIRTTCTECGQIVHEETVSPVFGKSEDRSCTHQLPEQTPSPVEVLRAAEIPQTGPMVGGPPSERDRLTNQYARWLAKAEQIPALYPYVPTPSLDCWERWLEDAPLAQLVHGLELIQREHTLLGGGSPWQPAPAGEGSHCPPREGSRSAGEPAKRPLFVPGGIDLPNDFDKNR